MYLYDSKIIKTNQAKCSSYNGIEDDIKALLTSGKFIPWQIVTISTDCRVLDLKANNVFNAIMKQKNIKLAKKSKNRYVLYNI